MTPQVREMFNNVYGCSICFNVMRSFIVARSGLVDDVGFLMLMESHEYTLISLFEVILLCGKECHSHQHTEGL